MERCATPLNPAASYRLIDGDVSVTELASLKRRADAAAKRALVVTPARILAPVAPSKIVAIGLNYKDHAAEMEKPLPAEPLMFLKPSTAVIGPGRCDSASGRTRGGSITRPSSVS